MLRENREYCTCSFLLLLRLFLLGISTFRSGCFLFEIIDYKDGADAGDDVESRVENDRGRIFNLGDDRCENHKTSAEDIAYAH